MSIKCEACNRNFYESVVRECPLKKGHYICQYCCRRCKRSYAKGTGRGCKAWDRERMESENNGRDSTGTA